MAQRSDYFLRFAYDRHSSLQGWSYRDRNLGGSRLCRVSDLRTLCRCHGGQVAAQARFGLDEFPSSHCAWVGSVGFPRRSTESPPALLGRFGYECNFGLLCGCLPSLPPYTDNPKESR